MEQRERVCPLGHACERCLWQIEVVSQNMQTGEVDKRKNCALPELVNATVHTFQQVNSVGVTIDRFRNETAVGNERFQAAMTRAALEAK